MKIFRLPVLRKAMGLGQFTAKKPLHAGEIYYLWEGLTGLYGIIQMVEMYLMNTEDPEIQAYLKGFAAVARNTKVKQLEKILKNEGFTVPPRPESKTLQGEPGAGQEVKLTDTEIILNMMAMSTIYMGFNARGVLASTDPQIRQVFKGLVSDFIIAYKTFLDQAKKRNALKPSPPATAKENSLSMAEVSALWDELSSRHLAQVNLETFIASTKDKETLDLLHWGRSEVVMLQMEQVETMLKKEGFTVPERPVTRLEQYKPGQINKISLSDAETLQEVMIAFQSYTQLHVRSFSVAIREDVLTMFEKFLHKELEAYEKTLTLAQDKHALQNPPVVSSMRI